MSNILKANITDIDEILDLQYLAFQTEADMLGTRNIPALNQQYDDVLRDFNNGLMLQSSSVKLKNTTRIKDLSSIPVQEACST